MKTETKKKGLILKDDLAIRLEDPEFALEYLKAALDDSDEPRVFLLALRDIADVRGMSSLARISKLQRENLYRILSEKGNPELSSLASILNALGFKLSVEKAS